jgi:phage baseplate assembly protein W
MAARDNIIGNGWRFPIRPDATGRLAYVTGPENIEQSLRVLLLTRVRERVMRRELGCKAQDLLFAPGSEQGLRLLETRISDAIRDFEPRIDVLEIAATADLLEPGRVSVDIKYQIRASYVRGSLVFPLYVDPGGVRP